LSARPQQALTSSVPMALTRIPHLVSLALKLYHGKLSFDHCIHYRRSPVPRRTTAFLFTLILIFGLLFPLGASAHNVSKRDASFVESNQGTAIGPFLYLGAKHMVTGYDHLAFLVGVIFFLYRLKDVVQYVSLFTLGHSITLLAGVLGGIHANSYVVDAIIGFSVVYKAFDNMDGFRRFLGFEPNTKLAVLIFGLFHGFGLATKLQELDLAKDGLVTNILSFNVGVEIGQVLALTAILIALSYWRTRSGFLRHAFATNTILMAVGFALTGYQIAGYYLGS
jgi:fumarate reductase subunit D